MGEKFWNFSITVYRNDAVQAECLHLQDEFGLDVNLVMFCAFLGAVHGAVLTADDIAAARQQVRQWHDDIVRALRGARRSLKTIGAPDAPIAQAAMQLRTRVKAAELDSERIEQAILEHWADARLASLPRGMPGEVVNANLQGLLAVYGIGSERLAAADCMRHLISASLAAATA